MTTPSPQDPFAPGPSGQDSYGQGSYGQGSPGGYGPPPPSWGGPARAQQTETKAIVALVLAIGSWVLLPLIPAVVALFVGSAARRDIRASGGWLGGDGLVTAAKIVAWANIVLSLLGIVVFVLALGLFATSGVTTTTS